MSTFTILSNYEQSESLYGEDTSKTISYFMMFVSPESIIAMIVSISFIYLHRMDQKNLRPDYDNYEMNDFSHENELENESEKEYEDEE